MKKKNEIKHFCYSCGRLVYIKNYIIFSDKPIISFFCACCGDRVYYGGKKKCLLDI